MTISFLTSFISPDKNPIRNHFSIPRDESLVFYAKKIKFLMFLSYKSNPNHNILISTHRLIHYVFQSQ